MTSSPTEKQTMKASKPAMEKRRRARINESLQELKALVLDGVNKNNSRHSKLEKADILEMAVRYLRNVQRQQVKTSVDVDPTVLTKYRSGFAECMGEVSRYLGGSMEENTEVRARLLGHLAGLCTTQQNHGQQPLRHDVGAQAQTTGTNHMQPSPKTTGTSQRLVAVTPDSSVQPYYMNFPTPPASAGRPPKAGRQTTLMTSPRVEGTRTGCGPQAPAVQNLQLPVKCDAPATPKAEVPVSGANRQSVIIAQNLPTRAAPRSIHSGDMITLVLPSQSLPGGQVPTHLIPVYASTPNTSISPPGFSLSNPGHAATVTSERAGNGNCGAVQFSFASSSSPNATSTAPATITVDQQAAWTAIPVPTAQVVSPQAGTVAPSAIASPFAISFPFNAEISPPRLPTQDKPREEMGRPIQLSGVFQNYEMSGDGDPMWRPW